MPAYPFRTHAIFPSIYIVKQFIDTHRIHQFTISFVRAFPFSDDG